MAGALRVAVTLEQCWHRVPGGTATSALRTVAAVAQGFRGGDQPVRVEQVGVSARHREPPPEAFRPPIAVAQLPLPRIVLYEAWHRLRWPPVERATGPVDVVHATGVAVPPSRAPLVVTVHDLAFRHRPEHFTRHGVRFFERALELTRRHAALVLCPSEATRADCVVAGLDEDRLRVVPWGVDPPAPVGEQEAAGVLRRHGIDGPYVLWVGTIEPRKNLPVLLDAFRRVVEACPGVRLVLAGPEGWHEDLAEHRTGLEESVVMTGFVAGRDLDALYAGASVFCYPSLMEGFGMPVLEAMAHSCPVVTSRGTATEEVGGDAAVLVDPVDVEALAGALVRILTDEPFAAERREASRARAEQFPWSRTAAATVAAYEDVAR